MTVKLLQSGIPTLPDRVTRREFNRRSLFDLGGGTGLQDAICESINSLLVHGSKYDHWMIAFSGGKDSSALAGFVIWAIEQGHVTAPRTLTVLYADTRMELPPLAITAQKLLVAIQKKGYGVLRVEPPIDRRYWSQILGRGLTPPKRSARWCTRVLKADPMVLAVKDIREKYGDRVLMLTGVRLGESAARDGIITTSCSVGDGECGQGWYQQDRHALAPLLHWRVCWVWKWLYSAMNPLPVTREIEPVYAADDIVDIRTGCIGCPIVSEDRALRFLVKHDEWSHLRPLLELHDLYDEMRNARYRLRHGVVYKRDGTVSAAKTGKMGPLTIAARRYFLWRVQQLEAEANHIMIDHDEELYIRQCWRDNVWPRDWTGNETVASKSHERYYITDHAIEIQRSLPNF